MLDPLLGFILRGVERISITAELLNIELFSLGRHREAVKIVHILFLFIETS